MIERGRNWHNIVLKILAVPFFAGLVFLLYQFLIGQQTTLGMLVGIMFWFLLIYTLITALGVLKKKHLIKALITGLLEFPLSTVIYSIAFLSTGWLEYYLTIWAYVDIIVLTILIGIFYYVLGKLLK